MCLPALPGQHDTQAPDLSKFAVRIFVESLDYPLASPANKEITGTALARDKFGISQMVRSVRFFLRLPDADHDSWEGDLLPALDPLCIRVCFFGFIALVSPGTIFHTLIPHLSNKLARLSDNLVRCRVRLSQRSADGVFCR